MENLSGEQIDRLRELVLLYFPDGRFKDDEPSLETVDSTEIVYREEQMISFLQTMLFEEHLVEVILDQGTRTFFANVLDDPPDLQVEEHDGEEVLIEPEYQPGSYLKAADSFLLTPLTPGLGNPKIRLANSIVVRFFKGTTAIELGCTFRAQDTVRDIPVLRLSFPVIGRMNRNFRSFRVRAPRSIEAKAAVRKSSAGAVSEGYYQIFDMSPEGMAFEIELESQSFEVGDAVSITVTVQDIAGMSVSGNVRNISKVRDKKGYKTICGVKFDLETRSLAMELEKLTAAIQRFHLREIAEKTADLDGVTIIP